MTGVTVRCEVLLEAWEVEQLCTLLAAVEFFVSVLLGGIKVGNIHMLHIVTGRNQHLILTMRCLG